MIRPAVVGDADALGRIHVRSWQVGYKGVFEREFLDGLDIQARADWFRRVISKGTLVLTADFEGDPVGFAMVGPARVGDDDWGEVFSIYVDPDFWGEGYGFRLLTAAEAELSDEGFERGLLWVLGSNTRARLFYERQDWDLSRQIKLEQIGGVQVNEVRYEKDLQSNA